MKRYFLLAILLFCLHNLFAQMECLTSKQAVETFNTIQQSKVSQLVIWCSCCNEGRDNKVKLSNCSYNVEQNGGCYFIIVTGYLPSGNIYKKRIDLLNTYMKLGSNAICLAVVMRYNTTQISSCISNFLWDDNTVSKEINNQSQQKMQTRPEQTNTQPNQASLYAINKANTIVKYLNDNNVREILIAHCYNGRVIRDDYYLNCIFKSENGKVKLTYATQNNPLTGDYKALPNEIDISNTFIKTSNGKAKCLGVTMSYNVSPCADEFDWLESKKTEQENLEDFNRMIEQKRLKENQIQTGDKNATEQKSNSINIRDYNTNSTVEYSGVVKSVTKEKLIISVGVSLFSTDYTIFINEWSVGYDLSSNTQMLAKNLKIEKDYKIQVIGYEAISNKKMLLVKTIKIIAYDRSGLPH